MTGGARECARRREEIAALVLDALEPDEAAVLEAHLAACPECEAERRRLAIVPALLDVAAEPDAPPAQPPAALEEAVLATFARERGMAEPAQAAGGRGRRRGAAWRRLVPAGGGALAGAGIAAAALLAPGLGGDRAVSYRLAPSALARGAAGEASLVPTPTGTSVRLHVRGLPSVGPDAAYELSFSRPGERMTAGTFRVGPTGDADVRMSTAADMREYRSMRVVLVHDAGASGRRTAVVLTGRL